MSIYSKVVIRCDAGIKYGLGHFSRCLTLSQEFADLEKIIFIIKTDSEDLIRKVIKEKSIDFKKYEIYFLKPLITEEVDLETINSHITQPNTFLILDHYQITDHYQLFFKEKNIKWLQFDSHAKIDLYATWVIHGSPAARKELYLPLIKNELTTLLLGTNYSIIKLEVRNLHETCKIRKTINQIIICFGGGNDYGATFKCLNFLDEKLLKDIIVKVSVNPNNKDFKNISKRLNQFSNYELISNENLSFEMSNSDLALIAPGMISYESACLGLPMLLITISDNQNINAIGWVDRKCAKYLGNVDVIDKEILNNNLKNILSNNKILEEMSINCFKIIDGLGAQRVKEIILNEN